MGAGTWESHHAITALLYRYAECIDAADFDGDGWQDLFVANIDHEFFSLYRNEKELIFTDQPGEIAAWTRARRPASPHLRPHLAPV